MIFDNLQNSARYYSLGDRIKRAFEFIKNTDFGSYKAGKYPENGDGMFFLVNEYTTKELKDCLMESHRKYIDLQYMLKGSEQIGHALLTNNTITKEYDSENDYVLYKPEKLSLFTLHEGEFAVFFPNDLHMTSIFNETPQAIKKIVVKVLINEFF